MPLSLSTYQYALPKELIASYPLAERDSSRLMIVDRKSGSISETTFKNLPEYLTANDTLIFNDTKVIPARLIGKRETGGKVEIFLIRKKEDHWEVMAKPAKKLPIGSTVFFPGDCSCAVVESLEDGEKLVQFRCEEPFEKWLEKHGQTPLPPYMQRDAKEEDSDRYQTVFAKKPGAVAAPTAALHFSEELLEKIREKGVETQFLTLHVGPGTFLPVQVENIRDHKMHSESVFIPKNTAVALNQSKGVRRKICVGTTSCRAMESRVDQSGKIAPGEFSTNLFIYPGYEFQFMDAMITNFHLPGSSLLMLVSAFGGLELIQEAYAKAIEKKFRFYSYGDAMLII